jgi:NAD(P)-dependent dehydrogenase (short-subunit alcohol dehydrogenase family)
MKKVVVLFGAGAIGVAIARRVGSDKHIIVADLKAENAQKVADTLEMAGYESSIITCDISSKEDIVRVVHKAVEIGEVTNLIQAAGVSPSQASVETILKCDLYGTAVILEEFGKIIAEGGSGIVISSQSGHRLPALTMEDNHQLATAPAEELLSLPITKQTMELGDTLRAYQISKRGNVLRVSGQAPLWGNRGARINSISPGIIITPLAHDELNGPRGAGYRAMLAKNPARRAGTPDEVAGLAAFLMNNDEAGYITGADFLQDGGATSNYLYGEGHVDLTEKK